MSQNTMTIRPLHIKIKDLIKGYLENDSTNQVLAWDGTDSNGKHHKLAVRPEYQRQFVYNSEERAAVINTVLHGFPLNTMYWVKRPKGDYSDGCTHEVLDGQQRIISICEYAINKFSVKLPNATGTGFDDINYPNLFDDDKNQFLNYELQVYECEGSDKEKLEWFQVINIAGEKLYPQEIRNAIYSSKWLTKARHMFSMNNGPAYKHYSKYLAGKPIRQDYLQTVLRWAANAKNIKADDPIAKYMESHKQDDSAYPLWIWFEKIMTWVQQVFHTYRKEMKGVEWGDLYSKYHKTYYDPKEMEKHVHDLMANDEIQSKRGIYYYVFDKDESHLNLRQFSDSDRRTMYERQNHRCAICGKVFPINKMQADHIKPWSEGGKTELSNGQMLCTTDNLKKSNK